MIVGGVDYEVEEHEDGTASIKRYEPEYGMTMVINFTSKEKADENCIENMKDILKKAHIESALGLSN